MPTATNRKTILLIDDSETIRQQVKNTLAEAGFEIVEACDGQAGIEAINSNPSLAMVICDLNMPRMDGLQFLEAYRGSYRATYVPVVMLTTARCPEEVGKAKRLGARGWIVKPFQPDRLLATVRWIVDRPAKSDDVLTALSR